MPVAARVVARGRVLTAVELQARRRIGRIHQHHLHQLQQPELVFFDRYWPATLKVTQSTQPTIGLIHSDLWRIQEFERGASISFPSPTPLYFRALVVSKVDCYSTVLAGVSLSLTDRLQSVLNAVARLVFSARRSEHVTSLLPPRPSLVAASGKNQVPSLCSDAPLSSWHRAAVPCRDTTTDLRHVCTSSSTVCRNADSGRSFDPSFNTWRPSVSCGCRTPSLRGVQSLTTFRRRLKTELFDSSFT